MARCKIGAHVRGDDPLAEAARLGVECVQFFHGAPNVFKPPPVPEDIDDLLASELDIYIHAPHRMNICSAQPRIRHPARSTLKGFCKRSGQMGAKALIVHGGYAEDGVEHGFERWKRALEDLDSPVPIYIENTAGGDNAVARYVDALAGLWEAVQAADTKTEVGFCFDTCHAHAAGEDVTDVVERVLEVVGTIDLLHANDSRDEAGSGADRHSNFGEGRIEPDALAHMIVAADAPVICETPLDGMEADLAYVRELLS